MLGVLIGLCIFFTVIGFIGIVDHYKYPDYSIFTNLIVPQCMLFIGISLLIWGSISLSIGWQDIQETELSVGTLDNKMQVSIYEDDYDIKIVNLNKKFGRVINDEDKVILKKYVGGWYAGVYYQSKYEVVLDNVEFIP